MVSSDFKKIVSERNLLRVRIMLKDSFVLDPTFKQLDEMLSYARGKLPNLFVPFDGEALEDDKTKWNEAVMNEELVQLVNNFSEKRVNHLKKVVEKVLKSKIPIKEDKINKKTCDNLHATSSPKSSTCRAIPKALKILEEKVNEIYNVMTEVKTQGALKRTNVEKMEDAAKAILKVLQDYSNR